MTKILHLLSVSICVECTKGGGGGGGGEGGGGHIQQHLSSDFKLRDFS